MAELTFKERLQTGHVKRWQIVRVAREQTLAEHLYLVRVVTLEMCGRAGFNSHETRIAELWALEHDVPEVKTGDLCTPVKAAMRAAVPHDDPIRRVELSYSDRYAEIYAKVKNDYPQIRALVKLADTLEAVIFLNVEAMGVAAREVRAGLWQSFVDQIARASADFPHYDWQSVYELARQNSGP